MCIGWSRAGILLSRIRKPMIKCEFCVRVSKTDDSVK